jgi:hypothetical protein
MGNFGPTDWQHHGLLINDVANVRDESLQSRDELLR